MNSGLMLLMAMLSLLWPGVPAQERAASPRPVTRSPHGNLNTNCENCHTFSAWKPIRSMPEFDHNKTRYPLRGMHASVGCRQCHTSLVFSNAPTKCADCHADIHRRQFGAQCDSCHTVRGWNVSIQQIRQHNNRFPLIGVHATVQCDSCHKNAAAGRFEGLSTDCYSCHQKDFRNPNFNHVAMGFPTTCNTCHSMDTWLGAKFDHARFTGFALTGMHAGLDCNSCHLNGKFKGTPADCYGCHAKDFLGTTNPNHAKAGFPRDCGTCHTTATWLNASFNHAQFTGFALTGGHANMQCQQCHVNNNYNLTTAACSSCHMKDYNGTTNPNHAKAGFPTDCSTCHTTASWLSASFNHAQFAGFALTGGHANVQCQQCHVNNNYNLTTTACSSCHMKDYNGTTNPNHAKAGFPTDCSTCHTTASWLSASFNHAQFAGFALTGAHANVPCQQCHVNNNYNLTTAACSSCHMPAYKSATNPNHVALGFPTDCSLCHGTMAWQPATFNHAAVGFPLTGAHATLQCVSCHTNGNFNLNSAACSSCHMKDYNGTTNPNHAAAGFPTDCSVCHTTTAWQPASFNHNNTPFPLTGAHTTVPCASCHVNNQFANTPTDCYSCHKTDYNNVTNPNHVAAHFPTTCNTCHNTTTWLGAVFNHTWFPIYSGTHAGKWMTCNDCHVNASNFAVFSCITCHQHSQANTDPNHSGVGGYVYNGTSCYTCHPSGRAG